PRRTSPGVDLAALLARIEAQERELAVLRSAVVDLGAGPTERTARSTEGALSRTSRRGLLRRLGTSAAGAAVAATALGATRPERAAADAAVTPNGGSTTVFGIYARPNGITGPSISSGAFGVVGVNSNSAPAQITLLGSAGVYGSADTTVGVMGVSN